MSKDMFPYVPSIYKMFSKFFLPLYYTLINDLISLYTE